MRVAQVTVAPTASDAGATVVYRDGNGDAMADADAGADGHQVDLAAGSNTVRVAVSKDSLTTTYTVKLLRLVTQQQLGEVQGAPTVSTATVNGATLVLTFNETLSATSTPAAATFTVKVTPDVGSESTRGVTAVAKDAPKGQLTLTLASAVVSTDTVTVSWEDDQTGTGIKDASDSTAEDFTDQAVTNNTPAAVGTTNNEATGAPTISGTNLVGQTQTANKGSIDDADGVPAESTFTYQWIRVSQQGTQTDITGATSNTYTPVAADAGKFLKVKVGFTDNANNAESRTSSESEVIGATTCTPAAPQDAIWSACMTVGLQSTVVRGYYFDSQSPEQNHGALSNTGFTVGGTTYTLNRLADVGTSTLLTFTSAPGNAASDWVLHIGSASTSFALSAATTSNAGETYTWTGNSLIWTGGDVISVWIAPPNGADDATLSALAVTHGSGNTPATLRPGFAAATKSYRSAVEHSVAQVTVTPTATTTGATIEYLDGSDADLADADSGASGHQVVVAVGLTTFKVKVTDGTATETYTVVMERDSDQPGGWTPTRDINTAKAAGNDFTRGVWGNATTLYVADSNDDKVYAYTRSDGTRNSASDIALDSANGDARGIWSNGTTLWVADETDVKVYAYTLDTKARDTVSEFALDSANDDAHGIWSNETTLWVADDDDAKVYAYTLATKARDTASEFALHQFNTDPWGIWSDRTTLWVADIDGRVYAYTLAGGARDTDKEFSLHSENTGPDGAPAGIWSDGTTMWVADLFNDKIYTYILPRANNEATGEPTISGTNLVGQTQTANKGTIADADGVPAESTFTYQWIRVTLGIVRNTEADITGATSKTYTTVAADAGKKLKVKVGFTDNAGNDESRPSALSRMIGYTSCTPAAPQGAIWSACLTVEHEGGSEYGYEFVNPTSTLNFGALSDTEFTVGGTTYTIDNIQVAGTTLVLGFTSAPGNAASDWTLHLSNVRQYDLSAATNGGTEYRWVGSGQSWSSVPVLSVWLTSTAAVSNNAPVFPATETGARSVAENTASGQNVGSPVAATDADTGDTLTYSLEGSGQRVLHHRRRQRPDPDQRGAQPRGQEQLLGDRQSERRNGERHQGGDHQRHRRG